MKENATASSRLSPRIMPADIVEPERETPGSGARNAWVAPTMSASEYFISPAVFLPAGALSAKNSNAAVMRKHIPSTKISPSQDSAS